MTIGINQHWKKNSLIYCYNVTRILHIGEHLYKTIVSAALHGLQTNRFLSEGELSSSHKCFVHYTATREYIRAKEIKTMVIRRNVRRRVGHFVLAISTILEILNKRMRFVRNHSPRRVAVSS